MWESVHSSFSQKTIIHFKHSQHQNSLSLSEGPTQFMFLVQAISHTRRMQLHITQHAQSRHDNSIDLQAALDRAVQHFIGTQVTSCSVNIRSFLRLRYEGRIYHTLITKHLYLAQHFFSDKATQHCEIIQHYLKALW